MLLKVLMDLTELMELPVEMAEMVRQEIAMVVFGRGVLVAELLEVLEVLVGLVWLRIPMEQV